MLKSSRFLRLCIRLYATALSLYAWVAGMLKGAPELPVEKRCDGCAHWDLEEGQASMRQSREFFERVAPFVSPQRMMDRYDADGKLVPGKVHLRAKENEWTHFGACNANDNVCHRAYSCDKWTKKAKA